MCYNLYGDSMQKKWILIPIITLLFSCSQNKSDLYKKHISNLLDDGCVFTNYDSYFDITSKVQELENNKYKISILFSNPKNDYKDITFLLLDNEAKDVTNAPMNLGYFNDSINFVSVRSNTSDQVAIRFNFLSDKNNAHLKALFSYKETNTRNELYFHIDV